MARSRAILALRALILGGALPMVISCTEMIEQEELVTVQTVSPTAHACGECHVAIYEEWAASAHSTAFTNAAFQRATLGGRTEACLGCHVPDTVLHIEGEPEPRATLRDEGVTCIACHLDIQGEAMVGPHSDLGPIIPHAVEEGDEWFFSSALCATCHTGTSTQVDRWANEVGETRACQECHMPAEDRKITQATDALSRGIVALHETYPTRSHTFEVAAIAEFPDAVNFAADWLSEDHRAIAVQVTNRLPHAMPTGDFGHREVMLSARLLDGSGEERNRDERMFTNRQGRGMVPGETIDLTLAGDSEIDACQLEVSLVRTTDASSEAVIVARQVFEIRDGQILAQANPEVTEP